MYRQSYLDIMNDSCSEARSREYLAILQSVKLMQAAAKFNRYGREAISAIYYTQRLWVVLVEDLGSDQNQLDIQVRARLISIGLWVLRECEKIRKSRTTNFDCLIEISCIIRDGLK
jgi:flagellar protein FlaF